MFSKNFKSRSHADHAISMTASQETLNQIQGDGLLLPQLFLLIICTLMSSSCAVRSVYVPTSQNVVLMNDKKQIQANAYIGGNHLELQVAHNPVNHLVTGMHVNYGTGLVAYEGLIGMYGYSKNNATWRAELVGGGGYNSNFFQQNNSWMAAVKKENVNYETYSIYNKYFVQPSIGFFSKIEMYKISYSFAFSCRASYLDFKKYVYKEIDRDSLAVNSLNPYIVNRDYTNKSIFILEPCFVNKVGLKNISAVIQGQFIVPMASDIDLHDANFSPVFLMSFGLQYNFVFKRQKEKKP